MSDGPARAGTAGGDPGQPADHGPRLSTKIGIDTEERTLGEIKTLLDRYLDNPVDELPATPASVAAQNGEATA